MTDNMQLKKGVSVIIATYNSARYLSETMASIDTNWSEEINEIVFVDGGSTDATREIITRWHRPYVLVQQSGRGIYNALNEGVSRARSTGTMFLHSDDLWLTGIGGMPCADEATVWVGDVGFFREAGHLLYTRRLPFFPRWALRQFPFIFHPNAIYPTNLLRRYPYNESPGNRKADMQQIAAMAMSTGFRRFLGFRYGFRIHAGSTTVTGVAKERERLAFWFWRIYVFLFFEDRRFARIGGRLFGQRPWKA